MRRLLICAVATGIFLTGCAPALAVPPHLVASWPLAGASLSVARHILELTFNRELDPATTWAAVWGDDGSTLASSAALDPTDARRLKIRLLEPTAGGFDLRWHAVDAESHLASDGEQAFTLQSESPAPPRIDVSPPAAANNDRLEVVGKGFVPDSPLQLTMGDNQVPLSTTRTDAQGKFNVEVRAPASVAYGVQPITAADGDGRTATGSVMLLYGGWPPVVGTNVGQPGPGPGEVTFTLSIRNLSDYVLEHVTVTLADPDGSALVDADADAQRQANTLVWTIAEMDRGPAGPFRATYRASAPVVSHAWIEFRHRRQRGCTGNDCIPAFISTSVADSTPTLPAS